MAISPKFHDPDEYAARQVQEQAAMIAGAVVLAILAWKVTVMLKAGNRKQSLARFVLATLLAFAIFIFVPTVGDDALASRASTPARVIYALGLFSAASVVVLIVEWALVTLATSRRPPGA